MKMIEQWWTEPDVGDQSMEDEHGEFWERVASQTFDVSLTDKILLDFGCNQGGFLRKLYDAHKFRQAVGVDLARSSIEVARSRCGDRPIEYIATDTMADFENRFDIAISTAVIYLIEDLRDHAQQIYRALKPGGIYFATHPDYMNDDAGTELRTAINRFAAIKVKEHTLDDIADAFIGVGFKTSIKRIVPKGYTSLSKPSAWYQKVINHVDAEYVHNYAFRCEKIR